MKTKLTMRPSPVGKRIGPDMDSSKAGTPFQYEVVDEHGRTVAWISQCAGDTTTWQIQIFEDGLPGDGTGAYETAEAAFAVLEKEFD